MTLRFLLVLNICLFTQNVFSQSQIREANDWYQLALEDDTPVGAMRALQNAIASDPKFVEALLQLGRVYKQTEQFQKAKTYLLRAYTARLAQIDNSTKSDILYELALTYKALGEIKASEDAFRGARNLTDSQVHRSKISLELGEILFQREQYGEAMADLSQCRELSAKDQPYYEQLLNATSKALEAEKLYRLGREAEDNRLTATAIGMYRKVEASMPGFRDVESRIDLLTAGAANPEHLSRDLVAVQKPTPQPAAAAEAVPAKTEKRPARKARPLVDEIQEPGTTRPQVVKVRSETAVPRAAKKTVASPHLAGPPPAKSAYSTRQTEPLAKTEHLPPTNRVRPHPPAPGKSAQPHLMQKHIASPKTTAYRSTYKAEAPEPEARQGSSRVLLLGSLAMGLLVLPLLGLVMASPTVRARMLMLLGLPRRAVPIYERMLLKHPDALWLYPSLAKLYYRDNRHDEQAMSVYRMIQHLNANGRINDSLTVNILNRYLSKVETASVQIEILENTPLKGRSQG